MPDVAALRASIESRVFAVLNRAAMATVRRLPGNRWRTFERYGRLIRLLGPVRFGRTYFGAILSCDVRDHIMKRIFFFGTWEPNVSKALQDSLSPGDTFVDIGANIGYDSLLGAKLVGATGHVVAIEASPGIYRKLVDNLALNGVVNVRAVNMAAGAEDGELVLHGGDRFNLGRTSPLAREGLTSVETVAMLPLDRILSERERAAVRLIKIDIEGGELPVLQRLIATLDLYRADLKLIVEMSSDTGAGAEAAFDALLAAGFSAFAVENRYDIDYYLDRPRSAAEPRPIVLLPRDQTDILFVRGASAR